VGWAGRGEVEESYSSEQDMHRLLQTLRMRILKASVDGRRERRVFSRFRVRKEDIEGLRYWLAQVFIF
jgi:hypothetical protein